MACAKWIGPAALLLAGALGAKAAPGQASARTLADFECDVRLTNQHRASVRALVRIAHADQRPAITFTLVRYPGLAVSGIRVTNGQGSAVPTTMAIENAALLLRADARAAGEGTERETVLVVHYEVNALRGRLARIPLPVPAARSAFGQRPVSITVDLPEGAVPLGDDFPAITWRSPTRGYARLSDVPSLAMIVWRPAGSSSLAGRLFTPPALTDAGMLLILLTGTVIWWRRRKAGATRLKQPSQARE